MIGLGTILNVITVLIGNRLSEKGCQTLIAGLGLVVLTACSGVVTPTPTVTPTDAPTVIPDTPEPTASPIIDLDDPSTWPDPCNPPEGVEVDGGAVASVVTWHDLNGDGVRTEDEPPLRYVYFNVGDGGRETNARGEGTAMDFHPGCACRCWEEVEVWVYAPVGYKATTQYTFILTADDQTFSVGFQKLPDPVPAVFPGEPAWSQEFAAYGLNILAFDYDEQTGHLTLEIEQLEETDRKQLYFLLFTALQELRATVDLRTVEFYDSENDITFTCPLDVPELMEPDKSYMTVALFQNCTES